MTSPLRAAVVGVGYLGRIHALKYKLLEGVELVAVVDTEAVRAQQVAQELGVLGVTDVAQILGQVDVVSVCTPTPSHYQVTSRCLEAGLHCLVEKPITVRLQEADALVDLAARRGCVLQVGHLKRFHPVVTAMEAGGFLRHPRYVEAHRLAPFKPRSLDVDVILDLMIHDVDLVLHFVGSDVVEVQAVGAPALTDQVDMANARLTFKNGCVANLTASRVAGEATRRMRIFQDDSYVMMDFIKQELQIIRRGIARQHYHGVDVPAIEEIRPMIPAYDTLEAQLASFCQVVREGLPTAVGGTEGRRALDVVIRIQKSIDAFVCSHKTVPR